MITLSTKASNLFPGPKNRFIGEPLPENVVKFKSGDRVHWYEYSADMIIINGGYGTIISDRIVKTDVYGIVYYEILMDGGTIREFSAHDLDHLEWNELGDELDEGKRE